MWVMGVMLKSNTVIKEFMGLGSRGELSPLVSVIIAVVLIVVGISLVMLFYHRAKTLVSNAASTPQIDVSASISGSTGVVTVDIYNAGTEPIYVSSIEVYGPNGSEVPCTWSGVGAEVTAGGSYGVVGKCSGVSSGVVYTVLVTLNVTSGSYVESLSVTSS